MKHNLGKIYTTEEIIHHIKNKLIITTDSCIYKITCIKNNRVYIGQTYQNVAIRWYGHLRALIKKEHYNNILQNSFNKYGKESFIFQIVELVINKEDLRKREEFYINIFNSLNTRFGFNLRASYENISLINREKAGKNKVKILKKILKKYPKLPNFRTGGKNEKFAHKWLVCQRRYKRYNHFYWFPILDEAAIKLGYPELFNVDKDKYFKKDLEWFNKLINFIRLNNKLPSSRSKNSTEKSLESWLHRKKAARNNTGHAKWYPQLDILAEKEGIPNLFITSSDVDKAVRKLRKILVRYKILPKGTSTIKQELIDARYLYALKTAKRCKRSSLKWYPELELTAIECGFPNLFNI